MKAFAFGSALLLLVPVARAEAPATNMPPGAQQEASATNQQPETPTPPEENANAKSAPGAQAPNGANGVTLNGKAVTKAPMRKKKGAVAAAPATAAAPAPTNGAPAAKLTPAPKPALTVQDKYLKELFDVVKLPADSTKKIEGYYAADNIETKRILGDASLSPLQRAQQVADLRDRRNEKIEALLDDPVKRKDFYHIEAKYRVALVEEDAKSAVVSTQAPDSAVQ